MASASTRPELTPTLVVVLRLCSHAIPDADPGLAARGADENHRGSVTLPQYVNTGSAVGTLIRGTGEESLFMGCVQLGKRIRRRHRLHEHGSTKPGPQRHDAVYSDEACKVSALAED